MHLPGYQLFYFAAIPLLLSAAFAFSLGRLSRDYLGDTALIAKQA